MIELEQRLGRLLDRAIKTGQVSSQFEEEMRGVVVRLLDDERDKIREQAQQAQSDKIALLEKKVERLASSLESAESERDFARERAQALEAAGGSLRNIMLAGLDAKDPRRARKLGLLKEIYKINRDIRKQLVAAGRLPQASAESPPHVHEEAKIASELGIKRSAQASGSPEAEKADADVPDATEVPVLATWTEVDPDDLPWESPGEEAAKESKPAKIKQFGRGR